MLWLVLLFKATIWFLQQTSMNVNWRQTTAIRMLTVLISLVALNVPATVDLKEMESAAQVWTTEH